MHNVICYNVYIIYENAHVFCACIDLLTFVFVQSLGGLNKEFCSVMFCSFCSVQFSVDFIKYMFGRFAIMSCLHIHLVTLLNLPCKHICHRIK